MRTANIDMTDVNNNCPQGLIESIHSSKRMCTCSNAHAGCSSVTFSTHNLSYTKVCGRARGYQFKHTDGFGSYTADGTTLNSYYLDGLSITYGSPRNHIWSFAAGVSKDGTTLNIYYLSKDCNYGSSNCPCAPTNQGVAAPQLGGEIIFVSWEMLGHMNTSGTLMTLCGTHKGVQVGAPAVIMVVHGSLPH